MIFIISFIAITRINLRLALISIIIVPIVLVISMFFFLNPSPRLTKLIRNKARWYPPISRKILAAFVS